MVKNNSRVAFIYSGGKFVEASRIASIALRIAYSFEEFEHKGGMIVCSVDINSTQQNGIKGTIKKFLGIALNRFRRNKQVDDAVKKIIQRRGIDIGCSIGKLFNGRYYDNKQKKTFNEKSFSIDIRGVPIEVVKEVGEELCKSFNQQSVLIVDHESNKVGLLYP